MHLVVLENRGHDAFEEPLERDRLRVVRVEREPNAPHRLQHLVAHRPDRGRVAVCTQLAARAHGPLLGAARHTRVRVHHAAVGVLAEPEAERDRNRRARRPSRRSSRSRTDPTAKRSRTCRRSGAQGARRAAPAARAPSRCGARSRVVCHRPDLYSHRHDCKGRVGGSDGAPDASRSAGGRRRAGGLVRDTNRSARRARRQRRASFDRVLERDRPRRPHVDGGSGRGGPRRSSSVSRPRPRGRSATTTYGSRRSRSSQLRPPVSRSRRRNWSPTWPGSVRRSS